MILLLFSEYNLNGKFSNAWDPCLQGIMFGYTYVTKMVCHVELKRADALISRVIIYSLLEMLIGPKCCSHYSLLC